MRAKVIITAILASLAGVLLVSAPTASAESSSSAFTSRLVTLVNQARAQHGLRALTVTSGTSTVAAGWSSHMASTNTLAHNPNLQSQLESHGSPNWTTYGENVGEGGASSADNLFTAYMNSPEHRANILGSGYRYLGIATVFAGSMAWNTMDFVDSYGSSTTTTTSTAPVRHTTTTTTVHHSAPAPVVRHTTAPKPAPVHKAAPAPRRHTVVRHSVVAQHVRSHYTPVDQPRTDVLLASGALPVVGSQEAPSSAPRVIASLIAALMVSGTGLAWITRRRVAA